MILYNKTKTIVIVDHVDRTANMWTRLRGLLGKREFPGKALVIQPCNQVHTWFMRFSIDVLFINDKNQVIAIERSLKPWTFSQKHRTAEAVIEAEAGTFSDEKVEVDDVVVFKKVDEHE